MRETITITMIVGLKRQHTVEGIPGLLLLCENDQRKRSPAAAVTRPGIKKNNCSLILKSVK